MLGCMGMAVVWGVWPEGNKRILKTLLGQSSYQIKFVFCPYFGLLFLQNLGFIFHSHLVMLGSRCTVLALASICMYAFLFFLSL